MHMSVCEVEDDGKREEMWCDAMRFPSSFSVEWFIQFYDEQQKNVRKKVKRNGYAREQSEITYCSRAHFYCFVFLPKRYFFSQYSNLNKISLSPLTGKKNTMSAFCYLRKAVADKNASVFGLFSELEQQDYLNFKQCCSHVQNSRILNWVFCAHVSCMHSSFINE